MSGDVYVAFKWEILFLIEVMGYSVNLTGGEQLLSSGTSSLELHSLSCCTGYTFAVSSQNSNQGSSSSSAFSNPLAFRTLPDTSSKMIIMLHR